MRKSKKLLCLSMSVLTGIAGSLVCSGNMSAYAEFVPSREVLPKMATLSSSLSDISTFSKVESCPIDVSQGNTVGLSPDLCYLSTGNDLILHVYASGSFDETAMNPSSWLIDGSPCQSVVYYVAEYEDDRSSGDVFTSSFTPFDFILDCYVLYRGFDVDAGDIATDIPYSEKDQFSYDVCFSSSLSYSNMIQSGGSKDLYYSVDADTAQATIVGGVSAKDFFGVDVPVTIKSSDYVAGKVGDYTIVLAATDSYGNTATATLRIHVVDRTAPVVTKKSEVSVAYGTSLTAEDVLSHYSITDNVDTSFTTSWTLPSNFSWGGALAYGTYSLVLDVKDTAGNETKVDVSVNVFDNIPPVISRKDGLSETTLVYGYSTSYALTLDRILALYKAADVVSGTCDVYVKSGSIDTSVGDHSLVLAAKDKCGNEAVKTVNYHIQVDIPPVFILSDTLVQVENDITLSVNDLTSIVESIVGSGSSVSSASKARMAARPLMAGSAASNIKINEDDFSAYVDGAGKAGTSYQIRYTYDDADGEVKSGALIVSVVESVGEPEESNPFILFFTKTIPDFISKLGEAFADLFQRIVNFFSFKGWNTDAELAPSSVPSSSASDPSVSE